MRLVKDKFPHIFCILDVLDGYLYTGLGGINFHPDSSLSMIDRAMRILDEASCVLNPFLKQPAKESDYVD